MDVESPGPTTGPPNEVPGVSQAGLQDRLRDRLRAALPAAIKARDTVAVAALRSALAAIDNSEAVRTPPAVRDMPSVDEHVAGSVAGLRATEVERRLLSEHDIRAVVEKEVADRLSAADRYRRGEHPDRAERLRAEAAASQRY